MKSFFAKRTTGLEWFLLIFGLAAVDTFVWIHTSAELYQAYASWAFDQNLRGLEPTIPHFLAAELGWRRSEAIERAPQAPVPGRLQPAPSVLVGRLQIPRLKLTAMIQEGADEAVLSRAVGHIPGTGVPGALGNVALAGHRDTFFRPLRNIRADDLITLDTAQGNYSYRVLSTEIVDPRDVSVLNASGGETLTLITCYPFYYVGSAPKRFVVRSVRLEPSSLHPPQQGS